MLAVVHAGTGIPMRELVGPALGAALMPVYSWYAIIVAVEGWHDRREHGLRLEADKAQAAWAALVARIQPHFLFNSLTSLEQLTVVDPPRAAAFVRRLAHLYRRILTSSEVRFTPLAEELALVDDYLFIQGTRFGDRLQVAVSAPAELGATPVPPTLLLTLVETAIKHGVEAQAGTGRIALAVTKAADQSQGQVIVRVTNSLPPKASQPRDSTGYGHRHITERLHLAYGSAAAFRFQLAEREAVAEIALPTSGEATS
jgi:LytS/YehU family sensor histidine kinase